MLLDKSFLGNSQRLSASQRCFCSKETTLLFFCVCVCECRHRRNMGRGKYSMSFWPNLWSFQPVLPYLARFFFWRLLFFCMMFAQGPSSPSTKGFVVFSQSLWAFSRSVGKMLNYKEHQSALFQDAVCSSNTIKCLCKALGALIIRWHMLLLNFNSGFGDCFMYSSLLFLGNRVSNKEPLQAINITNIKPPSFFVCRGWTEVV